MELTLYSALALSAPFNTLVRHWQDAHPETQLTFRWHPSTIIEKELNAGEQADVVIATVETLDRLIESGLAAKDDRIEVVDSPIGIAVLAGTPHPDIRTRERLMDTLLAARSVSWSEAGASGVWFSHVLKQLNIEAELRARGTVIPAGFTAEQLVNGSADLAVQQISELLMVPGIEIVGALPPGTQQPVSISASVLNNTTHGKPAREFLAWLKTPRVTDIFSQFGLVRRD